VILDCGPCSLHRYTAQDFVILVDGERAGMVRIGAGLECEVGFEIDPAYRRRGIATAAVRAVTEAVLGAGVVKRIVAKVSSENDPSIRVMEKCGYTLEGVSNGLMVFARTTYGGPIEAATLST
jgi:RimJ/RimL family protein N-acetyltransferase